MILTTYMTWQKFVILETLRHMQYNLKSEYQMIHGLRLKKGERPKKKS